LTARHADQNCERHPRDNQNIQHHVLFIAISPVETEGTQIENICENSYNEHDHVIPVFPFCKYFFFIKSGYYIFQDAYSNDGVNNDRYKKTKEIFIDQRTQKPLKSGRQIVMADTCHFTVKIKAIFGNDNVTDIYNDTTDNVHRYECGLFDGECSGIR